MKQENVISLYNSICSKTASAPVNMNKDSLIKTYAIMDKAKYATKEAGIGQVLTGAGGLLKSGGRFLKDVGKAGAGATKYGKQIYKTTNPSASSWSRLGKGLSYGAHDLKSGIKSAVLNNPKGAMVGTGLAASLGGTAAGGLAFGGSNKLPDAPQYDWQNDFMGSLQNWIKDNPMLAAAIFGGLGVGAAGLFSR